jgi:hypothetical protein
VLDGQAEEGADPLAPDVLQVHAVDALEVHGAEGAGHGVEPGRVDDDVELEVDVFGLDALCGDALDWVLGQVDEGDVGLVEAGGDVLAGF